MSLKTCIEIEMYVDKVLKEMYDKIADGSLKLPTEKCSVIIDEKLTAEEAEFVRAELEKELSEMLHKELRKALIETTKNILGDSNIEEPVGIMNS